MYICKLHWNCVAQIFRIKTHNDTIHKLYKSIYEILAKEKRRVQHTEDLLEKERQSARDRLTGSVTQTSSDGQVTKQMIADAMVKAVSYPGSTHTPELSQLNPDFHPR